MTTASFGQGNGSRETLATLQLGNPSDARPAGLTVTTAVPFARGVLKDASEIGFTVPGEAQTLERHKDGSVKWARVRVLPTWTASKATFVDLVRGGGSPTPPPGPWHDIPKGRLVLEDPDGNEWIAELGPFEAVEKSSLRELLRAGGGHAPGGEPASRPSGSKEAPLTAPRELYRYEILAERFPGAPYFMATLILRNDPPSSPLGAVRFKSYRLEFEDPKVRVAVAWEKQNGCQYVDFDRARSQVWLLPRGTPNLWLGDGQTKAWRLCIDKGGDVARFRSLASILERPILPGFAPAEYVKTRAWGDLGDLVLGPPPQTAAKLAAAVFEHGRQHREYGWNGSWGDVKDTHNTGSPRNALCSEGVLRTLQTGYREWFDLTWEKAFQQSLRPIIRGIRAADHPNLLLYEGVPHPKWKDQLGRENRPSSFFDKFREGTYGAYRQSTHGWNGFDQEHFTIDDLYATHLLTGDPWIRFELESIGQALLTYDFAKRPVSLHTSRGDGWILRGLCQLHRALGDPAYLAAAKSLVEGMDAERGKGDEKWLHASGPDVRHIADHPYETPWQVSIAINGLVTYHELSNDPLARTIALDAAGYLVKHCWDSKRGMFYADVSTDGSGVKRDDADFRGTQSWVPSGLVAAYRLDPKPEYLILADGVYEKVKTFNATFDKGGIQWAWWQSYLRQAYDRGTLKR